MKEEEEAGGHFPSIFLWYIERYLSGLDENVQYFDRRLRFLQKIRIETTEIPKYKEIYQKEKKLPKIKEFVLQTHKFWTIG